jgi:CRISPR-associated protein Cmr6
MPIAALPKYLIDKDLSTASPGLRFGMYLPIWTSRLDQEADVKARAQAKSREGEEVKALLARGMDYAISQLRLREHRPLPGLWDKNDLASRTAWSSIASLTLADQARMRALLERQIAVAQTSASTGRILSLDAVSTAPFTTGLGNAHPLENGFAFLNPYGLPYLPGSGVKGVLRQAARELASGEWGEAGGWSDEARHPLLTGPAGKRKAVLDKHKRPVILSMLDVLFGRETPNGDSAHVRGALAFWDVIPQIPGDSLAVDIMTPHQSHYYQQNPQAGSATPHESGQPKPISFLTVPAGARFVFHVQCDGAHLARLAPELAADERWRELLDAAFRHAFDWLGFGAKTAVGYGAMHENPTAAEAREAERARLERERQEHEAARRRAALPPAERLLAELDTRLGRLPTDPRNGAPIVQQTSAPHWHALVDWLATQIDPVAGLTKPEREALATAVKQRLTRHFKVEGKAEKAMKQQLSALRGE